MLVHNVLVLSMAKITRQEIASDVAEEWALVVSSLQDLDEAHAPMTRG
jgi:hypothetical protein